MSFISYGKQFIDSNDLKSVNKSLKESKLTTGPIVENFENQLGSYLGNNYTIVCNSGTSALHLALMAISLKKNDVIIMPAINFIAAYNMARLMNARIFLADVDPLTGQMTPKSSRDRQAPERLFDLEQRKYVSR